MKSKFLIHVLLLLLMIMQAAIAKEDTASEYANNPKNWPALHYAVSQNRLDSVREILYNNPEQLTTYIPLLSEGFVYERDISDAYSSVQYEQFFQPFSQSIYDGLTWYTTDTDPVDIHGASALDIAVKNDFIDIARELLEYGAAVNKWHVDVKAFSVPDKSVNISMKTCLAYAIENDNLEMVQLLLDYGVDDDAILRDYDLVHWGSIQSITAKKSAMKLACELNRESIIRELIHYQTHKEIAGDSVPEDIIELFKTWEKNSFFSRSGTILRYGTDSGFKGFYDSIPALQHTMAKHDIEAFETLLLYGANPNKKYGSRKSSLELALENNDPAFCEAISRLALQNDDETKKLFKKAIANEKLDVIHALFRMGYDYEDAFVDAAKTCSIELINAVLTYKQPAVAQLDAAIADMIANPKRSQQLFNLLYSLRGCDK